MIDLLADAPIEHTGQAPPEGGDTLEERLLDHSSLWKETSGKVVMFFGVVLPTLVFTSFSLISAEWIYRLLLKHPLETLLELGFVITVPIANYAGWSAYCRQDKRHQFRLGLLNGIAIATALITAAIAAAGRYIYDDANNILVASVAIGCCASSFYVAAKLRDMAETRLARNRKLIYAGYGVALTLVALLFAEGRSAAIRFGESLALSNDNQKQDSGLQLLRALNAEQDLRMQCADSRTAGIPGQFYRIGKDEEKQLYFAVTGKRYGNSFTDSVYSASDEYLQRNVVGETNGDLSLVRSSISGNINAESLTSDLEWTMVFKNTSFGTPDARAEIGLPPGAVISGLTLWSNGEPIDGHVGVASPHYDWNGNQLTAPAVVTDLGRDRYLLKCSAVPSQGELKVRVAITEKLRASSPTQASVLLPQLIAANFSLNGDHHLRIRSNYAIQTGLPGSRAVSTADGTVMLEAPLQAISLHSSTQEVNITRPALFGPFAEPDTQFGGYVISQLQKVESAAPSQLVIVLDGSASTADSLDQIKAALQTVPENIQASMILASRDVPLEAVPLRVGLQKLSKDSFTGGNDDLEAVIKAAEVAGDVKNSAVLWIHGPQPSYNKELYITEDYLSRPQFFEAPLDGSFTDTSEFFRNHKEVGPFTTVSRTGSIGADLKRFLARWRPGASEYAVAVTHADSPGSLPVFAKMTDACKLYYHERATQLIAEGQSGEAGALASHWDLVTAENAIAVAQPNPSASPAAAASNAAPALQGAPGGTIGPGGVDATVISGVNTAGTVRVNNLANLEALLNIIANGMEIIGLGYGSVLMVRALFFGLGMSPNTGPVRTGLIGAAIAAAGLAAPGMVNWLVASARDANLFS